MQETSENNSYGANVLDSDKNDVGNWYSTENRTVVEMKDGNRVVIYAPMAGMSGGGSSDSGGGSGGGSGGQ